MSVLKMQRISICALKKDRKAILERLQSLGVLEVDVSPCGAADPGGEVRPVPPVTAPEDGYCRTACGI